MSTQNRSTGPVAALFTSSGKMEVAVDEFETGPAILDAPGSFLDGSIALISRHGIRVFGTIKRVANDSIIMEFEEPLDCWHKARFLGLEEAQTPVRVQQLQLA